MRVAFVSVLLLGVLIANIQAKLRKPLRSDEACKEPGFFPDSADCQKFYRCAEHANPDGTTVVSRYEFKCPPGTVYDDSISTCNHLSSIENPPKDCTAVESPSDESDPAQGESYSKSVTPILLSYSPGWLPLSNIHLPISNYIIHGQ